MIIIFVLVCTALLLFVLYLWHLVAFGVRTRRVVFHSDPESRDPRASRYRRSTLWEVRGPARPRRATADGPAGDDAGGAAEEEDGVRP